MDPISKARRLHFATRVRERIGPDVDADGLARGLLAAIERDRTDLVALSRGCTGTAGGCSGSASGMAACSSRSSTRTGARR